jgi:predicted transcriptional regulator
MKLSQKQASLLAKEIVKRLNDKKSFKVSETLKAQIKKYCDKRAELWRKKAEVQEEINRHEMTLKNIIGNVPNVYGSDSMSRIIEKVEEKNVPSVSVIEDEIILKSMFESEDDMKKFVDSIVDKYAKKIQSKVVAN